MSTSSAAVRVRFAPSPTGHLHIGSLRTAIFNWLFARHHKGVFLVRVEDTDTERSKPEYTASIFSCLTWAGLESDEPVVIQSSREPEHRAVIDELIAKGRAYRCYCTQDEIIARCNKGVAGTDEVFISYDRYCRTRTDNPTGSYVVRFALPLDRAEITFNDVIRGNVTFPMEQFDDFIIARSDGRPMYNFVVVVDDIHMHISHIIRGEDHISNTPKQIMLYEALGHKPPLFAHLPLILGPSGERLSKRDAATAVLDYKQEGYLPQALENYLVRLGWAYGDQEIFTRQELIEYFSIDDVGKKGSIFDLEKLAWVNSVYMKHKSAPELLAYIEQEMMPDIRSRVTWDDAHLYAIIDLYKDRVCTMRALVQAIISAYEGPHSFDERERKELLTHDIKTHLEALIDLLHGMGISFQSDEISMCLKQFCKERGIKLSQLALPVRMALTGKSDGPGVFDLLAAVGKQESSRRIGMLLSPTARSSGAQ